LVPSINHRQEKLNVEIPLFVEMKGRNWQGGKWDWDYKRTFGVACLHAGQLTLLVNQTNIFFPLCLHAGELNVDTLTLQLKQAVVDFLSLSDYKRCKPVSKDIQLQRYGDRHLIEIPGWKRLGNLEFCLHLDLKGLFFPLGFLFIKRSPYGFDGRVSTFWLLLKIPVCLWNFKGTSLSQHWIL
jgi:hypothetical protein